MTIECYSDGSGKGPDGLGAASFLIVKDKCIIHQEGVLLKEQTNNEAEYTAMLLGIEWIHAQGYDNCVCYTDSELVYNQLIGRFDLRNRRMRHLNERIVNMVREWGMGVAYQWVPRTNEYIAKADEHNRDLIRRVRNS